MEIRFLGAANTVTGSQFLLITEKARVLIDCGMFQGGPNEVVRNRVPLAYDPAELDAIILTHAHLDHCGLIPYIVAEGFHGPIYSTRGTAELAALVLLDSGKLQEEFSKRQRHWALKHPEKAAAEAREEQARIQRAEQLAAAGRRRLSRAHRARRAPGRRHGGWPRDRLRHRRAGAPRRTGCGYPHGLPARSGSPNHEASMAGNPANPNLIVDEPLYDQDQAQTALARFSPVDYERAVNIAPGVKAIFHDAGHILGSSIVEVRVDAQKDVPARTIVFSGDLGRTRAPILRDPAIIRDADYVLVESTYGGRDHEPESDSLTQLEQAVKDVIAQQGVLLIPSFAIGRTQEIVWALNHLLDAGRIPRIKLYLDSPMASKASTIYRQHSDYYDAETLALLNRSEGPIDFPNQQETPKATDSELIARTRRPYVVVASNGMLTGGRVLNHLRALIGDRKAVILFVGYQGEGTLGARLQAGAKTARVDGQELQVRCAVRSIDGFSAHADETGILSWLGNFIEGRKAGDPGVPRRIFIVHGDADAQAAIEPKIQALGLPTMAPHWHQRVILD